MHDLPRVVFSKAFHGHNLFVVCQAARHWVVGEKENNEDSDKDGEESNDEEHDLPALESFAVIMLETEAHE